MEMKSTVLELYFYGNEIISMEKKEKQENRILYELNVSGNDYLEDKKTFKVSFVVEGDVSGFEEIMDDILNHRNPQKLLFLQDK